jgi:hypothetical protein
MLESDVLWLSGSQEKKKFKMTPFFRISVIIFLEEKLVLYLNNFESPLPL